MKKLSIHNIKTRFAVILSLLCFITISCEKEKLSTVDIANIEVDEPSYFADNGILIFKSASAFKQVSSSISNLSLSERADWEEKIGFLSQRRMIEQLIEAEELIDVINESRYAVEENPDLDNIQLHSEMYYDLLNKKIIKIVEEGTDNEYWDYAVFTRSLIEFINEDGLYAIGDTLFHVSRDGIKAIIDGDFSKKDQLIMTKRDDEQNNIVVLIDANEEKTYPGCPGLIPSKWIESGGGKAGEKRIKVEIFLDVEYFVASSNYYSFYHEVYVQCQERNWLRNWKYKFTEIWVAGSWEVKLFYMTQRYSNTYSINLNASYFKTNINPQTGFTPPYRSTFGVGASNPYPYYDQADYPPEFSRYNWSAVRDDGSSGLRVELPRDEI